MVAQHYRWDFVGLSTDTKPTPETSEKVVDGSTFYCSDTSKLYVFCKDTWYERKALGEGGGGGTTYTAGDGIDITDSTISVDTDTIQEKLTAGTGIDITDNTISATGGGGGGGIKFLSASDFNYDDGNTGSFNTVAIWLLDDGFYFLPTDTSIPVKGCLDGTNPGRFNYEVQNGGFSCFIKLGTNFWMFADMSNQDPTIFANRPVYLCKVNRNNGWYSYDGSNQLAKRSELSS